ncbi:MAG: hypothetical protein ACJAYR_000446 [Sneathiella sp.]|jgi:hypothetical protein
MQAPTSLRRLPMMPANAKILVGDANGKAP